MSHDSSEAAPLWTPPAYDASKPPLLYHETRVSDQNHNFARWAKWCPDGSLALAQCENTSFEYIDIPQELLSSTTPNVNLLKTRRLAQAAPILDFAWYPYATIQDPASFCFVASVRECPVHLLDAATGRLRASYKIVDHRERQVAPHSLAFSPTGIKLYCGFEDAIEVFDVNVPGEGTRLHTTPSQKSRDGLKGIISALAFSTDVSSGVFAAGSFSPAAPSSSNIALFSETTGEVPVMYVGNDREGGYGIRASASQVQFNPFRSYLLYASFRQHRTIYGWDLRGDVTKPIQTFIKPSDPGTRPRWKETNQRLRFDIDIGGNWLAAGDHDGSISMFDLTRPAAEETPVTEPVASVAPQSPTLRYNGHNDAVGSVSFHPLRPLLLSVSGSRHFAEDVEEDTSSDENESDEEEEPPASPKLLVRRRRERPTPGVKDASVKLWNFMKDTSNVERGGS